MWDFLTALFNDNASSVGRRRRRRRSLRCIYMHTPRRRDMLSCVTFRTCLRRFCNRKWIGHIFKGHLFLYRLFLSLDFSLSVVASLKKNCCLDNRVKSFLLRVISQFAIFILRFLNLFYLKSLIYIYI